MYINEKIQQHNNNNVTHDSPVTSTISFAPVIPRHSLLPPRVKQPGVVVLVPLDRVQRFLCPRHWKGLKMWLIYFCYYFNKYMCIKYAK